MDPLQPTDEGLNVPSALQRFAEYDFASDEIYQFKQGLADILSGPMLEGKSEEEVKEVIRQTQVFYFNRVTGTSVSVEDVPAHVVLPPTATRVACNPSTDDTEPRTLTFAELQDMIQNGRIDQIPNNKKIPDGLNDAPPSQSTLPVRKKPWEIASS